MASIRLPMKKRKVPHTFVIVFFIIVIAAVLTWIIPPGKYVTEQVGDETVMTFHYLEELNEGGVSTGSTTAEYHAEPQTWQVFSAFYKGFVKQGNIIVFILIIGGAFWIMNKSKAIDMGIMSFLKFTKRLERWKLMRKIGVNNVVIILIMLLFSLFGSGAHRFLGRHAQPVHHRHRARHRRNTFVHGYRLPCRLLGHLDGGGYYLRAVVRQQSEEKPAVVHHV